MPRHTKRDLTTIDGDWTGRTAATHSPRSEEARERARALRKNYLRAHGLHVVRFEAREVMRDVASVVSAIRYEIEKRLSHVGARVEAVGLVAPSAAEDGGTSPLGGGAGAGHAAPR